MSDLKSLEQNREALMLAEVAALLHDWQKCIPQWKKHDVIFTPNSISSELDRHHPIDPFDHNNKLSLKEIIEDGRNPNSPQNNPNDWRISLLRICHDVAHIDKPEEKGLGNESRLVGTIYGFEHEPTPTHALVTLQEAVNQVTNRSVVIINIEKSFVHAVGDTRRPLNEVTLWEWGSAAAALWKSIAARFVLEQKISEINDEIKWRILTISFDGLRFLERAPTIGDMLGRSDDIQDALNAVQNLLEETYPLGNEVYRDENGSAYVVPALDSDDERGSRLRGLIESHILDAWRSSKLGCELKPKIFVSKPHKQAAELHKALQEPLPPVTPFKEGIECWWQGESKDICTACGVRPQGWGAPSDYYKKKAEALSVCHVCLERRGQRSKDWAQARYTETSDKTPWQRTIWIDEVADKHGRLALIVGKFDLTEWLNGNLIETLLVVCKKDASDNYNCISKNPSFARIQRVWRTTQNFWDTVLTEDIPFVFNPKNENGSSKQNEYKRIEIHVQKPETLINKLGDYNAYDAEIYNEQINGRQITLVWDWDSKEKDTQKNRGTKTLLTAVRLNEGADEFCKLLTPNSKIDIFEPGGYGQSRKPLTTIDVQEAKVIDIPYTPIISLLSQPASFMMLVPASDALKVARKISHRYELEMSKVRNRLPLLLGAIFFDQRQPFFSALDAGRRMLATQFHSRTCKVECSCNHSEEHRNLLPDHLNEKSPKDESSEPIKHFNKWHELHLTTEKDESLLWHASTVMGDGTIPDDWYPYVHVLKDQHNQTPAGRKQFEHPKDSGQQWVHVSEIQIGDTVKYTPSRFTWLHLDTSARRFEALDEERIHPLEELERIIGLWERLKELAKAKNKPLTQSKLQAVVSLLAAKRNDWKDSPEQFKQLAETTLRIEMPEGVSLDDVISGRLERTFEIYHHILKEKVND